MRMLAILRLTVAIGLSAAAGATAIAAGPVPPKPATSPAASRPAAPAATAQPQVRGGARPAPSGPQTTPTGPTRQPAAGPLVVPATGRSAAPPARTRPGQVVPGSAAGTAPGKPHAGATERPPYKVGAPGNENWPSNKGFESARPGQLKPGEIVDRYGSGKGNYVAPAGTPYEQRSLRPGSRSQPYGMLEVKKTIGVTEGTAKAAFGQPGKGKQMELPKSVNQHLEDGELRRWPPDPTPAGGQVPAGSQKRRPGAATPAAKPPGQ